MKFCCNLSNCKRSFATKRGLCLHQYKDPLHNKNLNHSLRGTRGGRTIKSSQNHFPVPCDETILPKNQSIDADILSCTQDVDESMNSTAELLSDEESEDESILSYNTTYDDEEDVEIEPEDIFETLDNVNPEILRDYNLDYIKYQYRMYSEIFGIDAFDAENLEQFKDTMANFEIKRLSILEIYL